MHTAGRASCFNVLKGSEFLMRARRYRAESATHFGPRRCFLQWESERYKFLSRALTTINHTRQQQQQLEPRSVSEVTKSSGALHYAPLWLGARRRKSRAAGVFAQQKYHGFQVLNACWRKLEMKIGDVGKIFKLDKYVYQFVFITFNQLCMHLITTIFVLSICICTIICNNYTSILLKHLAVLLYIISKP